ncbi:MAG: hypothetical protein A2Z77_05280 [Chloroflexi bacterium RBG_13_51_36]|nr:MAG: hypothetical protein A2Z77_05280 [Chloroflexi bacterium RBG_13_51_36]
MKDGLDNSEKVGKRVFRRYFPLIFVLWILFVLYPNPANLIISIHRVLNFGADPGAVEFMLNDLPSDPAAIEKTVLARIHYRYDWEVYGMPWYCPTVEQVLEKGEGDCNGRALVFASILEAENISYQVRVSPIHIWVDYAGKNQTSMENPEVEYCKIDPQTGEKQFQIPHIAPSKVMDSFWQSFWHPMPDGRKALLISGPVGLVVARVILRKKKTARSAGN